MNLQPLCPVLPQKRGTPGVSQFPPTLEAIAGQKLQPLCLHCVRGTERNSVSEYPLCPVLLFVYIITICHLVSRSSLTSSFVPKPRL